MPDRVIRCLNISSKTRDQSGATTGRTEYEAFGNESYQDPLGDRGEYRFAGNKGYQNDDATGMQLLGARYYLPLLGRFLTQDPIGHEGGLNLYAYCDNSPLMRVDPDGTETRPLNRAELKSLGTAADFLASNGNLVGGAFYKVLLTYAPQMFQVDTEIGGAVWRHDTLYLGPTLFDSTGWTGFSGKLRDSRQVTNFEEKAWFASILHHEFDHVRHNETYQLLPWLVGKVERRAWGVQIGFLRNLQKGQSSGSQRSSRITNLIDRAKDGRAQYGN